MTTRPSARQEFLRRAKRASLAECGKVLPKFNMVGNLNELLSQGCNIVIEAMLVLLSHVTSLALVCTPIGAPLRDTRLAHGQHRFLVDLASGGRCLFLDDCNNFTQKANSMFFFKT